MSSSWKVKKGSTSIQDILIKDKDGTTVANLAAATAIVFQIKENEKDAAVKVEKTLLAGDIAVDTPSVGYLRITLKPADTDLLEIQRYFMAIKITWSATLIYEVYIEIDDEETEWLDCTQNIVL